MRVLAEPPKDPQSPDTVAVATVRRFYWKHHAHKIRSQDAARRAFFLLYQYLKSCVKEGAPKVGHFTLARQHDFMLWCRDKHGLKAKSISTYLSYIKAAFRFAATPRLVEDELGGEKREVRILSVAPHVVDGEGAVSKITGLPRSRPRDWIPQDHELAAMIDGIEHEHVFRYVIMALDTWARPEAILELDVSKQVFFDHGLIDLSPPEPAWSPAKQQAPAADPVDEQPARLAAVLESRQADCRERLSRAQRRQPHDQKSGQARRRSEPFHQVHVPALHGDPGAARAGDPR